MYTFCYAKNITLFIERFLIAEIDVQCQYRSFETTTKRYFVFILYNIHQLQKITFEQSQTCSHNKLLSTLDIYSADVF